MHIAIYTVIPVEGNVFITLGDDYSSKYFLCLYLHDSVPDTKTDEHTCRF